jgi:hypothetical protein
MTRHAELNSYRRDPNPYGEVLFRSGKEFQSQSFGVEGLSVLMEGSWARFRVESANRVGRCGTVRFV